MPYLVDLFHTFAVASPVDFAQDVPNPKGGSKPPGWGDLVKILRWVFLGVTVLCVAGILMVAGKMALAHNRGESREHMGSLGMVLGACILAGSASGLVSALI